MECGLRKNNLELHPSPTARQGNTPSDAITRGRHSDLGPFSANREVWCRQCGFRCNLERDARNINEFAGEVIQKGFSITNHDYDGPHGSDLDYTGSGRTTSTFTDEISNGSFENWTAGSPDSWTVTGSVTQITTAGFFEWRDGGVSSLRMVRSGSTIQLSQSPATPSDVGNDTLNFRVRVKSLVNGVIRIRVDINGTTYSSSYNVAQQNFQDMVLRLKCPATVSSLTVYIMADNKDGTAYIDSAVLNRDGAPTIASASAGCPHCSSFDYY